MFLLQTVMFTNRNAFDRVDYATVPMTSEIDSFELAEPISPENQFLDNLLKYRYKMGMKQAGLSIRNDTFQQALINDITTAMLSKDTKVASRFKLSHHILNRTKNELNRLAANLFYADIMNELPYTCWERFELTNSFNAIPYIMIIMNGLLSIISISLSLALCAKLWKLLP